MFDKFGEAAGQGASDEFAPAQMEAEEEGEPEELAGAMNPPEDAGAAKTAPDPEPVDPLEAIGYQISKKLTKIRKLADEKKFNAACIEAGYLMNLLKDARGMQAGR